jgi:hypothetical protein
MNFTEQIMLQSPAAIIDRFISFKSMQAGYILRFTARDARSRLKRKFLVQVLSPVMDTKIGESPIVRFFKSDFALYGNDRRTPVLLKDDTLIANISLSAVHIPNFVYLAHATEGVFCDRDLSFENFGGKREHAYATEISLVEVFAPQNIKISALKKAADAFVRKVKNRIEDESERIVRRDKILRGELELRAKSGIVTFRAEDKNGNRMYVGPRGEFMVIRLIGIKNRMALYEIRSGPHKGKIDHVEYFSIHPDPEKED